MLRILRCGNYICLEGGLGEPDEDMIGKVTFPNIGEPGHWEELCLPDPLWEEGEEVNEALRVIWNAIAEQPAG